MYTRKMLKGLTCATLVMAGGGCETINTDSMISALNN